ncbi:antitoxin Xre/MbcA/ParS toxin-binding domain-containing protein [Ascidiimonas sp. W6]|uniref:antitoxin Xre/MbcA/ParS toxin-binding domain-containing protein n=1 Tax=Ascidiimonas meishanensis TaxID=3128903 RepID=UPI0030ED697A
MLARQKVIDLIPTEADPAWMLSFLQDKKFTINHVRALKALSHINIRELSQILNINPKTFTTYTKDISKIKIDTKEHIILLISLLKKGAEVFGDTQDFNEWLESPNVFFDHKEPISFLNTISGIRFVDSRLTAMEYGDNV